MAVLPIKMRGFTVSGPAKGVPGHGSGWKAIKIFEISTKTLTFGVGSKYNPVSQFHPAIPN